MSVIVDVDSADYGMPFSFPGKRMSLKLKNTGGTGPLKIKAGFLIDNNLQSATSPYNLPFYMFPSGQSYSNISNAEIINYEINPFDSLLNLSLNPVTYKYNHSFLKSFDLGVFSSTAQTMDFEIYFLPYNIGPYSAKLVIYWNNNISFLDQTFILNFSGLVIGRVSEIDQTSYPELVFEVDSIGSNNFFEIEG